jgi:hypothetical protein
MRGMWFGKPQKNHQDEVVVCILIYDCSCIGVGEAKVQCYRRNYQKYVLEIYFIALLSSYQNKNNVTTAITVRIAFVT